MTILLATANPHKLHEIVPLLDGVPSLRLLSLRDFPAIEMPEETGLTMLDNARLKAEHCAREANLPALADDSGLEVDAMDGAPGVISARWVEGSDEDRTNAILDRLKDVPDAERGARYRCVLCLAFPPEASGTLDHIEFEGTCEGRITRVGRGSNGFGYDPVFEITIATGTTPEWIGRTMAEAPPEVKAGVSHRARALLAFKEHLRSRGT